MHNFSLNSKFKYTIHVCSTSQIHHNIKNNPPIPDKLCTLSTTTTTTPEKNAN